MPIVVYRKRRYHLSKMDEYITKMSMAELIDYERCLWTWMDKTKKNPSPHIVQQLNTIHREVEWRAQDTV
jgi:hypothetical protein